MKKEESSYSAKFWKPKIEEDITFYKAHLNNYSFDRHVHEDYTISVIKDGVMDAFMKGKMVQVHNLNIAMLNPDEVHSNASEPTKDYKHFSLYFSKEYVNKLRDMGLSKQEVVFKDSTLNDVCLAQKLIHLIEQDEKGLISRLDFESKLVSYVNELILKNTSTKNLEKLTSHEIMIERAKEYMNDNYSLDLSLEDIAKELDISKYHFLRLFKEKTFISPHAYLMARRVEKARESLQGGKKIIQSAYESGFHDQSHLNRRFKSVFGITPKEYQNFFL